MSWYRNTVWFVKGLREYTRYGRRPPGAWEAAWGGRSAGAGLGRSCLSEGAPDPRPGRVCVGFLWTAARPRQAGEFQPRGSGSGLAAQGGQTPPRVVAFIANHRDRPPGEVMQTPSLEVVKKTPEYGT